MEIYFTWSGTILLIEEGKYCDPPGYWKCKVGKGVQLIGAVELNGREGK